MNTKSIRKLLLAGVAVAVLLLAFALVGRPGTPAKGNNVFTLQVPPFVGVALANTDSVTSTIENEAGISAYFQAPTSINLSSVRSVFRTIEAETADYIIGSVAVPNYGEEWDVHGYVHKDGWVLVYYPAGDPVGKIFDWIAYHNAGRTNIRTKLENTLVKIADAAEVPFTSATYYHFQRPDATHLMLIVEWTSGWNGTADSFQVKLPGSFTYYERSWSLGSTTSCPTFGGGFANYKLDGITIQSHGCGGWIISQGLLTANQLLPDQFHTIEVEVGCGSGPAYGGLALVYKVP
jgi:hypothetical protein